MLFDSCENNNSSQENAQQLASSTFIEDLCSDLGKLESCAIKFKNKPGQRIKGINDSISSNNHIENNDSNAFIVITIPGFEIDDSIKAFAWKYNGDFSLYARRSYRSHSDSIGAELSEFRNDSIGLIVELSGYEIKKSLNPMVISSKNYLKAKGFTEDEIDNLLKENNLTEYNLIEIVIGLTECERYDLLAYNEKSPLYFQAHYKDSI